ncbi:4Fe-4S binding protein [Desulfobacula sp.]|uniref:4Fe-4S binding protein n=1 Tax=Desulfobacula sp. TaxID=2593537 RepID=UPI002631D67B|nr:4Fe-4S binding protein [Desulfobacula sp.]
MNHDTNNAPPMAAATKSTIDFKTGSWRFETPVFVEQLAPCTMVCPLGIDIPVTMSFVENNQLKEAYGKVIEENPFPGICGEICFHPCEKACNRERFDQAVSIKDLEKYIAHSHGKTGFNLKRLKATSGKKVAVVGSGPAGFSCAYFLACLGHQVTMMESGPDLEIFMMAPENKLSSKLIEQEVERIMSLGVELRTDTPKDDCLIENLAKEFNAVYVSQKAWASDSVEMGTSSLKNVYSTRALFSRIKAGNPPVLADHPVIIAGGKNDSDADYSKSIVRKIASGKQAALVLDMSINNLSSEQIRQLSLGRMGSLSMETYQLNPSVSEIPRTHKVVQFQDLNPAYLKKSPRITPSLPDNLFTQQDSQLSAERCFKCGKCTFCYNCYDYCPDLSIHMDAEQKQRKIDYDYCKGCGICVQECPRAAIILTKG